MRFLFLAKNPHERKNHLRNPGAGSTALALASAKGYREVVQVLSAGRAAKRQNGAVRVGFRSYWVLRFAVVFRSDPRLEEKDYGGAPSFEERFRFRLGMSGIASRSLRFQPCLSVLQLHVRLNVAAEEFD